MAINQSLGNLLEFAPMTYTRKATNDDFQTKYYESAQKSDAQMNHGSTKMLPRDAFVFECVRIIPVAGITTIAFPFREESRFYRIT